MSNTRQPQVATSAPSIGVLMGQLHAVLNEPTSAPQGVGLKVGLDLGTANTVLVVLDADDRPLSMAVESGSFVRDGVVVDFVGAIAATRQLKATVEATLGAELAWAHGAIPPGVPESDARAVRHVIEAAGMSCTGLIDEPTAANAVLGISDGVVVDVGGGTTGIAVLSGGEVIYVADEPTGGTHFTLVLAGALGIPYHEADEAKCDPTRQRALLPIVTPVMEKVASIVTRHVDPYGELPVALVGGPAMFPGFADVMSRYTGLETHVPEHPLLVTPLGIARSAPPRISHDHYQ